jgi:hypothetical protein
MLSLRVLRIQKLKGVHQSNNLDLNLDCYCRWIFTGAVLVTRPQYGGERKIHQRQRYIRERVGVGWRHGSAAPADDRSARQELGRGVWRNVVMKEGNGSGRKTWSVTSDCKKVARNSNLKVITIVRDRICLRRCGGMAMISNVRL